MKNKDFLKLFENKQFFNKFAYNLKFCFLVLNKKFNEGYKYFMVQKGSKNR